MHRYVCTCLCMQFFFNSMYMQMYHTCVNVHFLANENVHADGSCVCVCEHTRKGMRVRAGAQTSQPE